MTQKLHNQIFFRFSLTLQVCLADEVGTILSLSLTTFWTKMFGKTGGICDKNFVDRYCGSTCGLAALRIDSTTEHSIHLIE